MKVGSPFVGRVVFLRNSSSPRQNQGHQRRCYGGEARPIEDVGGFRHLERAILNADDVKPQYFTLGKIVLL